MSQFFSDSFLLKVVCKKCAKNVPRGVYQSKRVHDLDSFKRLLCARDFRIVKTFHKALKRHYKEV